MNSTHLPVFEPIISTYSNYADMFSILPNSPFYKDWLCEHYSNITYVHSAPTVYELGFCDPIYTDCELLNYDNHIEKIYIPELEISEGNIVDYLKMLIANQYYVIVELNQIAVPGTIWYERKNYIHRQLFYGYSDDAENFYTLGYLNNMKYSSVCIPYHLIPPASIRLGGKIAAPIHTICVNEAEYLFRKSAALEDHLHYYNSTPGKIKFTGDYYYGLEASEKLHDLVDASARGIMYDTKPISIFFEHKKIQQQKMIYYESNLNIGIAKEMHRLAATIVDDSYRALMLYIKLGIKASRDTVLAIHRAIESTIQKEQTLYPQLLNALGN